MRDTMYEKEKEDERKEVNQAIVDDHMSWAILDLLAKLNWDDLDYNREEVKEMIRKAVK